jgi:hypothetical protein
MLAQAKRAMDERSAVKVLLTLRDLDACVANQLWA